LLAGRPSAEVVGAVGVGAVVVGFGVDFLVVVAGSVDDPDGGGEDGSAVVDGCSDVVAGGVGDPGTVDVMVTTTSEDVSFTGVEVPR